MDGLDKPTASTGKRIDELYGAAKRIAQMSNIGGAPKLLAVVDLIKGWIL